MGMSEAEAIQVFTWSASVLCASAVIFECVRILRFPSTEKSTAKTYFLDSDWFLPIYSAGILQWTLFGLRTSDPALYVPCALQLLFMTPILRVWFRRRLQA